MFTRIQARGFRCLRAIDQELGPFSALVGPNASGKTTFLDVIGLLADLMKNRGDVVRTLQSRSDDFARLLWRGEGSSFELAVEARIPADVLARLSAPNRRFEFVRYEVEFGLDQATNDLGLERERLWLLEPPKKREPQPRLRFPSSPVDESSLFLKPGKGRRVAVTKKPGGNDTFYPEGRPSYTPSFRLGRGRAALADVPADDASFPAGT